MPGRDWKVHVHEVPRGAVQKGTRISRSGPLVVEAGNVDAALRAARTLLASKGWELRSLSVSTVAAQELIAYVYTTPRPR